MEQPLPPIATKRKSSRRLWLAVLLVAAIIISAGIWAIFSADLWSETGDMAGSFSGTPQRQADGYKLTLGVVAPKIAYADCKVVLTINGTFETAQMINISGGNEFPANNIIWTDLLEDGIVNVGDSLVVSDPVSTVTYFVAIIWAPFGNSICTQTWTVP